MKFLFCLTFLIGGLVFALKANGIDSLVNVNAPFQYVEQMPEFPNGEAAMNQFISLHLHYPPKARDAGIKGRVIVSFVVDTTGSLEAIKTTRDIGYGCGDSVVAVMNQMPKWKCGTQNGKKVKVQYHLPVVFSIEEDEKKSKKKKHAKKPINDIQKLFDD